MSCDTRRGKMCGRLATVTGIPAATLEQIYATANAQAAQQRREGTRTAAQDSLAALQAQQMMDCYRDARIDLPFHAERGAIAPKAQSHAGHAAMYAAVAPHRCSVCQRYSAVTGCVDCPGRRDDNLWEVWLRPSPHHTTGFGFGFVRTVGTTCGQPIVECVIADQLVRWQAATDLDGQVRVRPYVPDAPADDTYGTPTQPTHMLPVLLEEGQMCAFVDAWTGRHLLTMRTQSPALLRVADPWQDPEFAYRNVRDLWKTSYADAKDSWNDIRNELHAAEIADAQAREDGVDQDEATRLAHQQILWEAEHEGVISNFGMLDPDRTFASAYAELAQTWTGATLVERIDRSHMARLIQYQRIAEYWIDAPEDVHPNIRVLHTRWLATPQGRRMPVIVRDPVPPPVVRNPYGGTPLLPSMTPALRAAKDRAVTTRQELDEADEYRNEVEEGSQAETGAIWDLDAALAADQQAQQAVYRAEPHAFGGMEDWQKVEVYLGDTDVHRALRLQHLVQWADADSAYQSTDRVPPDPLLSYMRKNNPTHGYLVNTDRVLLAQTHPEFAPVLLRWMHAQTPAFREALRQANAGTPYDPVPLEQALGVASPEAAHTLQYAAADTTGTHTAKERIVMQTTITRLPYAWKQSYVRAVRKAGTSERNIQ